MPIAKTPMAIRNALTGTRGGHMRATTLKRTLLLLAGAALALVPIGRADAVDQCTQIGGTVNAGVCTVTGSVTIAGTFNIDEDLLIKSGASIKVSPAATGLGLTVNGNFTMEAG